MSNKPRRKSDIMLKSAVEEYFQYVLRLLYPDADQIFNMEKGFEWMNKELHEIKPQLSRKGGSREADVLVKVHLLDGREEL
jgi:hypothetical protein